MILCPRPFFHLREDFFRGKIGVRGHRLRGKFRHSQDAEYFLNEKPGFLKIKLKNHKHLFGKSGRSGVNQSKKNGGMGAESLGKLSDIYRKFNRAKNFDIFRMKSLNFATVFRDFIWKIWTVRCGPIEKKNGSTGAESPGNFWDIYRKYYFSWSVGVLNHPQVLSWKILSSVVLFQQKPLVKTESTESQTQNFYSLKIEKWQAQNRKLRLFPKSKIENVILYFLFQKCTIYITLEQEIL